MRAFDALAMLRDVTKSIRREPPSSSPEAVATRPGGALETTFTNVVVAALKEAFDRDHARLELERLQLEEQRRRAEEALRLERRRQEADRELARLRLLAATALVGWIASLAMFALRGGVLTVPSRAVLAAGWLLLLGALGTALTAQRDVDAGSAKPAGTLPVWLLLAGLALTALSLLF
jgi:hypothetical protein